MCTITRLVCDGLYIASMCVHNFSHMLKFACLHQKENFETFPCFKYHAFLIFVIENPVHFLIILNGENFVEWYWCIHDS